MKTTFFKSKKMSLVWAGLFIVALTSMLLVLDVNRTLKNHLETANMELRNDKTDFLIQDAEKEKLSRLIDSLSKESIQLKSSISAIEIERAAIQKKLQSNSRNAARNKGLENKYAELTKQKNELDRKLKEYDQTIAALRAENTELNESLKKLQAENIAMKERQLMLNSLVANNFKIQANKGRKSRLTVVAKRTRKLSIGLDLPVEAIASVHFKIHTPDGTVIKDPDPSISVLTKERNENLTASLSFTGKELIRTSRVEMSYQPPKKLKPGLYKIEIYNNDTYLATCQIALR